MWSKQDTPSKSALFNTTNIYTYISSTTDSDLCQRGKNKDSKHHTRQVGASLLVDQHSELPMHFNIYPGNEHDSKVFYRIIDEMFGVLCDFNKTNQRLTVVFDKGMNGDDNIEFFNNNTRINFITTYSPFFAEELTTADIKVFQHIDTEKNRCLKNEGKEFYQVFAYRTSMDLWGKTRNVVVTHNPKSLEKKKTLRTPKKSS